MSAARKLLREVLVPMWCRKILKILTRRNSSKSSNKRQLHILRRRRRKRKIASLVASSGIMLGTARRVSGSPKKYANMVEADRGILGYGNLLPIVLSVWHSPDWWVDTSANIDVCAHISLFSSYQVGRTSSLLMGNGACAAVCDVGTVDLKLYFGKDRAAEERATCPLNMK